MGVVQHELTFPDAAMAAFFVKRLHVMFRDVASMRTGERVWLIDGGEPPQTEAMLRLARASSAKWDKFTKESV